MNISLSMRDSDCLVESGMQSDPLTGARGHAAGGPPTIMVINAAVLESSPSLVPYRERAM